MVDIRKYFEDLGFSGNEIDVYLTLKGLGNATVTEIAKKCEIHRANIYDSLSKLENKGLVFRTNSEKTEYYVREPEGLRNFMERKLEETDKVVEELESLNFSNPDSSIGETKGDFSFKEAFFGLLDSGKEIRCFGFNKKILKIIGPNIEEFERIRNNKGVKIKIISNSETYSEAVKIFRESSEIKMLPKKYDSIVTTFLCEDKIVIVRFTQEILINHINSEIISSQYSNYFDILWSKADSLD